MEVIYTGELTALVESKWFDPEAECIKPKRFRFIDCKAFVDQGLLQLVDCDDLSLCDYSAVSYVWRGNQRPTSSYGQAVAFTVRVSEYQIPGDLISIEVLRTACLAASRSASYLWLDQICILQTNREDKTWQIRHMNDHYRACKSCLVLAGGLSQLPRLQEETVWIHRGWTLQEAITPKTMCIFLWDCGSTATTGLTSGEIVEIEKGQVR